MTNLMYKRSQYTRSFFTAATAVHITRAAVEYVPGSTLISDLSPLSRDFDR